MTAWLDWIGKSYYSKPAVFLDEAQTYGATRRVSLRTLKKMNWNDRMVCVQKEGKAKSGSVFCVFPITRLSGLTPIAQECINQHFKTYLVSEGGREVEKECGSYTEGASYAVEGSLPEIARALENIQKNSGEDIGQLMVGCYKDDVQELSSPYPHLKDVPYSPAIRPFDWTSFNNEVIEQATAGQKRARISGQLYTEAVETEEADGDTQIVVDYQKRQ